MRLLLDTHALLWFCEGNAALSPAARTAIEDRANERYVSHASAWETAIKLALGKLTLLVPTFDAKIAGFVMVLLILQGLLFGTFYLP